MSANDDRSGNEGAMAEDDTADGDAGTSSHDEAATTAGDDSPPTPSEAEGMAASSSSSSPSPSSSENGGSESRAKDMDNAKSRGDADNDSDGQQAAEVPHDVDGKPKVSQQGGEDEVIKEDYKVKILPNDPIKLPATSAQTKADALEEEDDEDDATHDNSGEQSTQKQKINASARQLGKGGENNSDTDMLEEDTVVNAGSKGEAGGASKDSPSTRSKNEKQGGNSEKQGAGGDPNEVDSTDKAKLRGSGAENSSIQSAEPSAQSNSSKNNQTDNSATDPKTSEGTTGAKKDAGTDAKGNNAEEPPRIELVDYASKLAGAQILEQSPSIKGASNLLTGDKDKYSIAPCESKRHVVVGLSEDILVKQIKLANYERYSSRVREFEVLASQEYPVPNDEYWNSIGRYEAKSKGGEQGFELEEPAWARYLKFRFLSHYGSEHYCTLSQIKVHGSTMLQGFHEQWIESEKKEKELEEQEGWGQDQDQEQGGEEQEGEEDSEARLPEEGGKVKDKGNEEKDTPQEIVEETEQYSGENEEAKVDETERTREAIDDQADESKARSANGQEGGTETETVSTKDDVGKRMDAKAGNESWQDPTVDSAADGLGSDKGEIYDDINKFDDGSNESSMETNVYDQAAAESEGASRDLSAEADKVHVEGGEAKAEDEVLAGSSTSTTSDAVQRKENISEEVEAVKDPDDEKPNKTHLEDSADTGKSDSGEPGRQPIQNDSISAVTGIVEKAYNATSGAIKNVKDAVRATVAGGKTGEPDKSRGDNATLDDRLLSSNGTEGELEGKQAQASDTSKQDEHSKETIVSRSTDNATAQPNKAENGSAVSTPQDVQDAAVQKAEAEVSTKSDENAKQKAKGASSKTGDANVAASAADSKPEKRSSSTSKEDSKTKEDSKAKEDGKTKEDTKTKADSKASAGREPPRRGSAIAGKDSKTDSFAGELFEKLSDRFPHASCMKDLDFQAFKSKTLAANNAGKNAGGTGEGAKKMEPIFNKITSEIKSVQITQNQYEQYISALKGCYESVFYDMANDLDSLQSTVDKRLASLERAVFLSEMSGKGGGQVRRLPLSYDQVAKLLSKFPPLAASAFQFAAAPPPMPNGFAVLCAGIVVLLLLLLRCLGRGRKKIGRNSVPPPPSISARESRNEATSSDLLAPANGPLHNNTRPSQNDSGRVNAQALITIPELTLAKDQLEKENEDLTKELNDTKGQLALTTEKLAHLQSEHAALQREHAELKRRGSDRQVLLGGSSAAGDSGMFSTPTPSIAHSESASSSEARATPPKPASGKPGVDSPLKNRFRKKKNGARSRRSSQ